MSSLIPHSPIAPRIERLETFLKAVRHSKDRTKAFQKLDANERITIVGSKSIASKKTIAWDGIGNKTLERRVQRLMEEAVKKLFSAKTVATKQPHNAGKKLERQTKIKVEKARRHSLCYALFEKAKPYIDIPSNRKGLPQASSGKTPVYLPKELPIVLKESGSPQNQKRFDQMKQGREICEQSGYENLIIPKARVYGNFIVESRLPITEHGTKEQIGLYIENRERFTSAIKEFTGFLCQSTLNDIRGGTNDAYETLSETPLGRYDNIALYLEEDQGKIGLIDLERFTPECSKQGKRWCFFKCRAAVNLFPYHLDEILDTAKKFDPNIHKYRKDLEIDRDGSLKRFKLVYDDHLDFIVKKNITIKNPLELVEVNSTRKEKIKNTVVLLMRKNHADVWFKNCLGKQPEEVLALFEKSFPKILNLITDFLSQNLKNSINITEETISSYRQLLSCRTVRFGSSNAFYQDLQEKIISELQMLEIKDKFKKISFTSLIIQCVFEELAKSGEIAYYNPRFGYDGYATQCAFY